MKTFQSGNEVKTERYNRLFNAGVELLEAGFTSKSAKKECVDKFNRCYEMIEDDVREECNRIGHATWDTWCEEKNAWYAAHDIPFGLHQYREAKHKDMTFGWHDEIMKLVGLREMAKNQEIGAKPENPNAIERKAEKKAKDAWERGFRTSFWISWSQFTCRSVLGNLFERTLWYRGGNLEAFGKIMVAVQTQQEAWSKNGAPDMAEWEHKEIKAFYKKHGALI